MGFGCCSKEHDKDFAPFLNRTISQLTAATICLAEQPRHGKLLLWLYTKDRSKGGGSGYCLPVPRGVPVD